MSDRVIATIGRRPERCMSNAAAGRKGATVTRACPDCGAQVRPCNMRRHERKHEEAT